MNVSIILGHPNPGSFNHAIAHAAREEVEQRGGRCFFHDLAAEGFDPELPAAELARGGAVDPHILAMGQEVVASDGLVIVHPNWWGQPPAVLKGWIDRILRMGTAYRFGVDAGGEGVPIGLLGGKWAIVINTSNTPAHREAVLFGDPLEHLWRVCVLGFCGITDVSREVFAPVITSTADDRAGWLARVRGLVAAKAQA
jgi:putative NADPH-quinone reductase